MLCLSNFYFYFGSTIASNGISSNLQKLLKNFNSTSIFSFLKTPFSPFGTGWATVFSNNFAFYFKNLKLTMFAISLLLLLLLLKLFASSLE